MGRIYLNDMVNKKKSYSGKEIKDATNRVLYDDNSRHKELTSKFFSKFIDKTIATYPIKDHIYYYVKTNDRNEYTVERDKVKSPRFNEKYTEKPAKTKPNNTHNKVDKTGYSALYLKDEKDKLTISRTNVPIHIDGFTISEDDIICLECGFVYDLGLSVVPHEEKVINDYTCPKCNVKGGAVATFNKHDKKFNIYR